MIFQAYLSPIITVEVAGILGYVTVASSRWRKNQISDVINHKTVRISFYGTNILLFIDANLSYIHSHSVYITR